MSCPPSPAPCACARQLTALSAYCGVAVPAGQRVEEKTYPGQCWRARTTRAKGGQHLVSYCATSAAEQHVRITPQEKVALDFHYPYAGVEGLASRASVYELSSMIGHLSHEVETLVGHVSPGGHLATSARAGSRYRVRDGASRRPLLPLYEAGFEAEQHVDIAERHVTLEFELGPSTAVGDGAAIYWTWGGRTAFAREHFFGELRRGGGGGGAPSPPDRLRVTSPPGEQWLVRKAARPGEGSYAAESLLLDVTASASPQVQKHVIVLPPAPPAKILFGKK